MKRLSVCFRAGCTNTTKMMIVIHCPVNNMPFYITTIIFPLFQVTIDFATPFDCRLLIQ